MDGKARIALLMGFASSLTQIVVIRQLFSSLSTNELSMGLILGGWMAATGIGCIAAEHIEAKKRNLTIALLIGAAMAGPSVFIARSLPYFMDSGGVQPGLSDILVSIAIACLPFAGMYGVQLNLLLRSYESSSGSMIKGYYMDSIGDVAGGALFTLLFAGVLDNFQAAVLGAVSMLSAAMVCEGKISVWTLSCVALIVAFNVAGPMELSSSLAYPGYSHVDVIKSKYGEVFVGASEGGKSVFFNGKSAVSHGDPVWGQQAALLPLMQTGKDPDILVIGSFDVDITDSLRRNGAASVDMVLKDPALTLALTQHMPQLSPKGQANIIHADARTYVMGVTDKYDIIIVDVGDPDDAVANSYYTREFFRGADKALKDRGILAIGVGSQENYLGREMSAVNADIHRTLQDSFPSILAIPASKTLFLASKGELDHDIVGLSKKRGLIGEFISDAHIRDIMEDTRRKMLAGSLTNGSVNTDLRPVAYLSQLRVWMRSFGEDIDLGWVAMILTLTALCGGLLQSPTKSAVFSSGVMGTICQTSLLLAFQAFHGHIYHFIGILTASFMAGLAFGAKKASWGDGRSGLRKDMVLFAAYSLSLSVFLPLAPKMSGSPIFRLLSEHLGFPILCIITGYIVGMAFAHAAHDQRGKKGTVASLYGNDLFGGFVGSSISAAFLIPYLGMPQTLAIAAAIACMSYLRLRLQ